MSDTVPRLRITLSGLAALFRCTVSPRFLGRVVDCRGALLSEVRLVRMFSPWVSSGVMALHLLACVSSQRRLDIVCSLLSSSSPQGLVCFDSFKGEFIQINATTLEHRASAQDVSRLVIDNRVASVQCTCHYHPCFGICVGQLGAPGFTFF